MKDLHEIHMLEMKAAMAAHEAATAESFGKLMAASIRRFGLMLGEGSPTDMGALEKTLGEPTPEDHENEAGED